MNLAQLEEDTFEVVKEFIEIIKQEKLSPTILQFNSKLFTHINQQIAKQTISIKEYLDAEQQSQQDVKKKNFMHLVYDAQVQKLKYLLKMYLRIRLAKIQTFSFYLLKNAALSQKLLSSDEQDYLKKYCQLKYKYLFSNSLKMFPTPYQGFSGIQANYGKNNEDKLLVQSKQSKMDHIQPDLDIFCFIKVIKNSQNLRFNLDIKVSNMHQKETQVISQQEIIFGPYKQVAKLIQMGNAKFI